MRGGGDLSPTSLHCMPGKQICSLTATLDASSPAPFDFACYSENGRFLHQTCGRVARSAGVSENRSALCNSRVADTCPRHIAGLPAPHQETYSASRLIHLPALQRVLCTSSASNQVSFTFESLRPRCLPAEADKKKCLLN